MSYCPEHGNEMVCRNPDDYDGLVYDCPEGHTMIYADGAYQDATHPDFIGYDGAETCPTCGADIYIVEPIAPTYPWHRPDDDCRAIRTPPMADESSDRYCGCGHIDLRHSTAEEGYSPCVVCECEDFSLPDDGLTKGMEDVMVVRGSQLVAKEYAQASPEESPAHTQAVTAERPRNLTQEDIEELADLGKHIVLSLECDIQGTGVPCRTDRLAAVGLMRRYVEIHDS